MLNPKRVPASRITFFRSREKYIPDTLSCINFQDLQNIFPQFSQFQVLYKSYIGTENNYTAK